MENLSIHIARFIVEAETPLFVGSGKSSLLKDALVQRDANGFPMIPGTTLAGVLRHSVKALQGEKTASDLFGSAKTKAGGEGSPVKVSSGMMLLEENFVSEGLITDERFEDIKAKFDQLPVRQHVRITDKGAAKDKGLFDNEVVYKGVCFVFELEAYTDLIKRDDWEKLLKTVKSSTLRLGSGTRNGYGLLKPVKSYEKCLPLDDYMDLSPSFNEPAWWSQTEEIKKTYQPDHLVNYRLELRPDPFFLFGSGHGDADVDQIPLTEYVANYKNGKLNFEEECTVIPASSVKGAIAHRVAYYFNRDNARFAEGGLDKIREMENLALDTLFGKAGENVSNPSAGNVFFRDVFLSKETVNNEEILNHVVIDRFTGGAMEGLLFGEKVGHFQDEEEILTLQIELHLTEDTKKYQGYLEDALRDICRSSLPLGGMTTKGHGIFTGIPYKTENNQTIDLFERR